MKRVLLSKIFPLAVSKNSTGKLISEAWSSDSRSCNLLLSSGLIIPSSAGVFHFTPPLLRTVKKLENLIDDHMANIDAQKLQMATLGTKTLWTKTGRWVDMGDELLKTKVGSLMFCLSPTHEEAVCSVMGSFIKQLSYVHLPIRLYQTTTKFRGELRPHAGLLRCREFLMNDLYTFDTDQKSAFETYNQVGEMYDNIFRDLSVKVIKAAAKTGMIGGTVSHEYHIESDVGEDEVLVSQETGEAWNFEHEKAQNLKDSTNVKRSKGIEVGHMFLLGDKYSKALKALFVAERGNTLPCEMGCYGLGVTRIIGACLETLSTDTHMVWPDSIAPYKVCIIPPKAGSIEKGHLEEEVVDKLYDSLQQIPNVRGDVIIDDRTTRTIGWRLNHAGLIGYPVVIILGKGLKSEEPQIEIVFQGKSSETKFLPLSGVFDCIKERFS